MGYLASYIVVFFGVAIIAGFVTDVWDDDPALGVGLAVLGFAAFGVGKFLGLW